MFGALSGGEKPRPGRPEKMWLDCVSDDLKAFQATRGSTEDSPVSLRSRYSAVDDGCQTAGQVARRGRRRSGAVHGGVAPTGRVEEARATRKRWREAQRIGGGRGGSTTTVVVLLQLKRVRSRWQIGSQGSRWTNFSWKVELRVS